MQRLTSILVDIDATAAVHPALDRAVDIASRSGASLRIVDAMSAPSDVRRTMPERMEDELTARRRQQLARIAFGVRSVPVEVGLLSGPPVAALIEDVARFGHDLVVRAHTRDLVARGPRELREVDVELFRNCPCPVWAVGAGAPPEAPTIICAVDPCTQDAVKRSLNSKVVDLALLLARLQQGSLVVLHAWRPAGEEHVYNHSTDDAFAAHLDDTRNLSKECLRQFVESFGQQLAGVRFELRRGRLEEVLAQFVVSEGVDLVVMGTLGRSGLTRHFVGNTAVRVLRRVPASVVAVKPDGFVPSSR